MTTGWERATQFIVAGYKLLRPRQDFHGAQRIDRPVIE